MFTVSMSELGWRRVYLRGKCNLATAGDDLLLEQNVLSIFMGKFYKGFSRVRCIQFYIQNKQAFRVGVLSKGLK